MREIKFRGFDGESLQVLSPDELASYLKAGLPVSQYTGLKDKNGKEIYEGDIVKWPPKDNGVSIVYWKNDHGAWNIPRLVGNGIEVIGNIYENPELLNQNY